MPKIISPRRPARPKLPKRRRKAATSPYDEPGGIVPATTHIRSHKAPRGRVKVPAGPVPRHSSKATAETNAGHRATQGRHSTERAGARAQLAARARTPEHRYKDPGIRLTPSDIHPEPVGRNYPRRPETLRQTDPDAQTRQQLADRGRPARPHPLSGELARPNTPGRGSAPRPRSPLPGDPAPAVRGRRNGRPDLADVYFRRR